MVYTCLTFSMLSKTMVLLSATILVQGGCRKCLLSWEVYEVHSDATKIQFFCDVVLFPKIPSAEQAMVGLIDGVLGARIGSYCYLIHRT